MSKREELEERIAHKKSVIDGEQMALDLLKAQLAALPPEPVRLRVEITQCSIWIYPCDRHASIAHIYKGDCEDAGIDPLSYATYCAAFGQPAPPPHPYVAHEAQVRALVEAAKNMVDTIQPKFIHSVEGRVQEALRALDAAIGGGE